MQGIFQVSRIVNLLFVKQSFSIFFYQFRNIYHSLFENFEYLTILFSKIYKYLKRNKNLSELKLKQEKAF